MIEYPHCWRFNEVTNTCSLDECRNKAWLNSNEHRDWVSHYQRTHNLSSYKEAKKGFEHDQTVASKDAQLKRIIDEIKDEIDKYKPHYYVETIKAKYIPHSPKSFHDSFFVIKEEIIKEHCGINSTHKERIAKCNSYDEAQALVNQLQTTIPVTTDDDVKEYKICPKCGSDLVERTGMYGDFVGCSNYPSCDYSRKEWSKL